MTAKEEQQVVIREFLDALDQARDAEEFEWIMLGKDDHPRPIAETLKRIKDMTDAMDVSTLLDPWDDGPSALEELKGRRALERLQTRHPELWERTTTCISGSAA